MAKHRYNRPIRIVAAGGLGTPISVAAAVSLGVAYVLTGSINQSIFKLGLSPEGKTLLTLEDVTDMTMAPAADMFELGGKSPGSKTWHHVRQQSDKTLSYSILKTAQSTQYQNRLEFRR
jgi:NAD(P)H-dependent flavin oxidoreductase YrpB (nitropropane dioxygenase family)